MHSMLGKPATGGGGGNQQGVEGRSCLGHFRGRWLSQGRDPGPEFRRSRRSEGTVRGALQPWTVRAAAKLSFGEIFDHICISRGVQEKEMS